MWYVVQTLAGQEEECAALCRAKADLSLYKEMFVPLYIRKMHFQKQWHDVKRALFPGYFFIDTEEIDPILEELAGLPRLAKVLRNADRAAPVTKEEQAFLAGMMDEEHVVDCSKGLVIGNRVCITEGPLRGKSGMIRKIDRHRRTAGLEVELFGRPTPVEAGLEILARLTEEEFEEKKAASLEEAGTEGEAVLVKSGGFAGMRGSLISRNEETDEWRVGLRLLEGTVEAVFSGEEIAPERGAPAGG